MRKNLFSYEERRFFFLLKLSLIDRPAILFGISFGCGLYFSFVLPWHTMAILAAGLIIVIFAVRKIAAGAEASDSFAVVRPWLLYCLIALAAFAYGQAYEYFTRSDISKASETRTIAESPVAISGSIGSPVEVDGDRVSFVMKAKEIYIGQPGMGFPASISETVQVFIKLTSQRQQKEAAEWRRGDQLGLNGKMTLPQLSRNFGAFDYGAYLNNRRIQWIIEAEGLDSAIREPAHGWGTLNLFMWADRFRHVIAAKLSAAFSDRFSGFMSGLLLGMRDGIELEQYEQFSQIGMTHILAISGLHVAILLGGFMGLLTISGVSREANHLAGMIVIPFYVLLTGASPSVVRAGMMAVIALYASRKRMLKDGLNIVGLTATAMLIYNPYYLFNVSFQLSFAVTIGLIVGVPVMSRLIPIRAKWLNGLCSVTITAQLVSFPLTIFYFNQFSLLSWLANLLFVPLISLVVLPFGMVVVMLGLLGSIGNLLLIAPVWMIEKMLAFTLMCVDWLNELESLLLIWPTPGVWWIALYYVLLCFAIRAAAVRKKRLWMTGLALLGALLIYGYQPDWMINKGSVHFIDVGQGDSALIRTPAGETILVDGGGLVSFRKQGEEWKIRRDPFEVGKKVVVPLLKKRGIHELDYLIVTHGDFDHIGGLEAVVEHIPVRRVIFNGTVRNTPANIELFRRILEKNIPVFEAEAGKILHVDDATSLYFLFPLPPQNKEQENVIEQAEKQNDLSVVFIMKMYSSSFLFTGDIGASVENKILLNSPSYFINEGFPANIDVLKVAHHGSKHSTGLPWMQFWEPQTAVISVGINRYGHPSEQVIDRLESHRSTVVRTDMHGEVQFLVEEHGLKLRTKLTGEQ
jgi:competence protein ComEC